MAKDRGQQNEQTVSLKQFLTFDVAWFFANLFVYGLAMSVVENFLLVFLNEDFDNTPKLLLGASTAMMCFFEVPVFKYVEKVWANNKDRLTSVLMACKVVLAFRCICYTLLPASNPWLVLLIEPLHGFTLAVTRVLNLRGCFYPFVSFPPIFTFLSFTYTRILLCRIVEYATQEQLAA